MLARSNVAAASALCVLGWALIFGISADVCDKGTIEPAILVILGRVDNFTQGAPSGEATLAIDDGARIWSCTIAGGVARPEAGSLIFAYCKLPPGLPPEIICIGSPWSQNVF